MSPTCGASRRCSSPSFWPPLFAIFEYDEKERDRGLSFRRWHHHFHPISQTPSIHDRFLWYCTKHKKKTWWKKRERKYCTSLSTTLIKLFLNLHEIYVLDPIAGQKFIAVSQKFNSNSLFRQGQRAHWVPRGQNGWSCLEGVKHFLRAMRFVHHNLEFRKSRFTSYDWWIRMFLWVKFHCRLLQMKFRSEKF